MTTLRQVVAVRAKAYWRPRWLYPTDVGGLVGDPGMEAIPDLVRACIKSDFPYLADQVYPHREPYRFARVRVLGRAMLLYTWITAVSNKNIAVSNKSIVAARRACRSPWEDWRSWWLALEWRKQGSDKEAAEGVREGTE